MLQNPIEIRPISINIKIDTKNDSIFSTRYTKPRKKLETATKKNIKYQNAEKLANELILLKGESINVIVNGTFIFGDFIEAFIVEKNYHIKKMTISTLSMSFENVDSLENILLGGYIDELNLIVSGFHYSQKRNTIVKYTLERLDINDCFQIAVADCHTKICCFETHCGNYITIKGSANLSSSGCIEEFSIEENKSNYLFYDEYHQKIVDRYNIINKSLRGNELWRTISETEQVKNIRKRNK